MPDLNLQGALDTLMQRAGDALHQVATDGPFAEAQANVPRDRGALAESGHVSDPVSDGHLVTVTMSWGDPANGTDVYAVVQHERLDLVHPNGGSAKWCENAMLAATPTLAAQIAETMRGGG